MSTGLVCGVSQYDLSCLIPTPSSLPFSVLSPSNQCPFEGMDSRLEHSIPCEGEPVLFQLWFFSYSCSYSYDFSVSVQVSVIILFRLLFQLFHFSVTVTVILNRYKFYEHTRNSVPLQVYNGSYHQYVFEISTYNSTKLHVTSFIVQCQSVTGTHCSHYSLHTSDTVTCSMWSQMMLLTHHVTCNWTEFNFAF